MRDIQKLVVHCAATMPSMDIGAKEIRQWHLDKGWKDIGYHYVIRRDGSNEKGRPDEIAGAHVAGHNKNTIGICLVGGINEDGYPEPNFTDEQFVMLRRLLTALLQTYALHGEDILGHRDFPNTGKSCPCFSVRHWWATGEVLP
jgi:N-acetyl-anhydromuramyl-L-alanine amidase AmpD